MIHNDLPATVALPPHLAELADELPADVQELIRRLPPRLINVAAEAPAYVDRRTGEQIVRQHVMPTCYRSFEVWRLPWRHANGKAITWTLALLAVAYAKLTASPIVMGGRRHSKDQHAE